MMERSAEDLICDFKSKVEEAINLLPQIPETERHDLWTYWQVISVAVKAAVGGRGPIVSKQSKTRGRPRRRPRLYGTHREPSTGKLDGYGTYIKLKDDITLKDSTGNRIATAAKNENCVAKQDTSAEAKVLIPVTVLFPSQVKAPTQADGAQHGLASAGPKEESEGHESSKKDEKTAIPESQASTNVSCKATDMSTEKSERPNLMNQEVVLNTSRGEDDVPRVSFVSLPKQFVVKESAVKATEASAKESRIDDTGTAGLKASVPCLQVSVAQHGTNALPPHRELSANKRKRGRPPKNTVVYSIHYPPTTSSEVAQSKTDRKVPVQGLSEIVAQEHTHSKATPKTEEKSQDGLQSIITALELEEKKVKDAKESEKNVKDAKETEPPAAKVRRSGRRSAPNRDKLFCYFDKTKPEEEEEEKETKKEVEEEEEGDTDSMAMASAGEPEEKDVKDVKVKTEEEKTQERTCRLCGILLMSASSMAVHMRIHTGERPFSCPVCHKTFTTKGNRERHKATHVGLKAFTCTQCNKKFTEKKSLKIHMRSHTGERPYECNVCGMRFFQTGTLKTHMDRHTGRKSHLCDLCGKAFRQGCQLRVHMRRHAKDMAFPCKHCNKRFYTKSDMERHELKHTGERPFACDKCPETFTRQQYLREHQNTHLGRRPYKCVVCGMSFHDFASCHRHINKHKVKEAEQPPQQIHVEVAPDVSTQQVIEQVQVILDQQNLPGYHGAQIQTLVIPATSAATIQAASTDVATVTTADSSAQTILRKLMLGTDSSSAGVYQVTLVDDAQDVTVTTDISEVQTVSDADFSAINLLASATTQLSLPT